MLAHSVSELDRCFGESFSMC